MRSDDPFPARSEAAVRAAVLEPRRYGPDLHPAPDGEQERFWEDRYRGCERLFSGRVNAVLAGVVTDLPAGTVLDLGCGEGGDAVWLARRGWSVTGADVSATALARVARLAAEAGVADRVSLERHDLARTLPAGAFDLVCASYLASPVAFDRYRVLRRAAAAVAPGGLLLVVDHGSVAPWSSAGPGTRFPSPQEVVAALDLPADAWRTVRADVPERQATGPGGQVAVVRDLVVALRRTH